MLLEDVGTAVLEVVFQEVPVALFQVLEVANFLEGQEGVRPNPKLAMMNAVDLPELMIHEGVQANNQANFHHSTTWQDQLGRESVALKSCNV